MHIRIFFLFPLICLLFGCTTRSCKDLVEVRDSNSDTDINAIYCASDLPGRPLTLEDIICIAWKNNLDALAKEFEWAVQKEVATREMLRMLPSLTFNAEYSERSNSTAASSELIPSGIITPPSISVQQKTRRWDLTFSWRILDFALAYFRSQAEGFRALNFYMQFVRIKQNMVLEITRAYWKVISARHAMRKTDEIIALTIAYRNKLDRDMNSQLISNVSGLRIEDQLLTIQLQLYNFDLIYQSGLAELSALMGLPADLWFELAEVEFCPPPELETVQELEALALRNRPELYGADLDEQIACEEVRQAMVQILPAVELFRGYNENADKFLVNHHWIYAGMRIAYDLLSLPSRAFNIKSAKLGQDRAYVARLALSVGILAQVHLAYLGYENIQRLYAIRLNLFNVRNNLAKSVIGVFTEGESNMIEVVLARANALISEIDYIRAYGDLQVALEQINNTIGQPLRYTSQCLNDYSDQQEMIEECEAGS